MKSCWSVPANLSARPRVAFVVFTAALALGAAAPPTAASTQVRRADLNQDGLIDLIRIGVGASSGLVVELSGALAPIVLPTRFPLICVVVEDVDGDEDLDLAAVRADLRRQHWLNAGPAGGFVPLRQLMARDADRTPGARARDASRGQAGPIARAPDASALPSLQANLWHLAPVAALVGFPSPRRIGRADPLDFCRAPPGS